MDFAQPCSAIVSFLKLLCVDSDSATINKKKIKKIIKHETILFLNQRSAQGQSHPASVTRAKHAALASISVIAAVNDLDSVAL